MFLRIDDFWRTGQINQANFNQILEQGIGVSGDEDIIEQSELSGRYRVGDIFEPFQEFDINEDYFYGDRINLTADAYVNATAYTVGTRVLYQNKVYECILNSTGNVPTNATYWLYLGLEGIYHIAYPNKWDDRIFYAIADRVTYNGIVYERRDVAGYKEGIVPTDTNYYDLINIADYTAVTGVVPNNVAWTYSDNRNISIVKHVITVVLYNIHKLINPRNIPAIRQQEYDLTIEFLKDVVRGKANMDLPGYAAQTGYALRAGSQPMNTNTY
jgi:hypothetical protein